VVAVPVAKKAAKSVGSSPGVGVLVAVVGALAVVNAVKSASDAVGDRFEPIIGGAENIIELPKRAWDWIKPPAPPSIDDMVDNSFTFFGYDLRGAPADLLGIFQDEEESDYMDYAVIPTPVPRAVVRPISQDLLDALEAQDGGLI